MECLLCGKNYINLGVHLRHKHHADPADYKEQFGLMKTMPLVDADLSEHISKSAKRRLLDPDYRREVTERCLVNAKNNIGVPPGEMSNAGRNKLSKRNAETHAERLAELAPVVASILEEKKTILDVRRGIGMGRNAVLKIVKSGKANYRKDVALAVGTQRRVASRMNKRGA